MVSLVPIVILVAAFVFIGQKEQAFTVGVERKIVLVTLVIVALSFAGLL